MTCAKVLATVALAVSIGCGTNHPDSVVIGTGPTDGVYYPYGEALATIFGGAAETTTFSAIETLASVDNLRRMHGGTLDLALTLADTLADAHAGTGSFTDTGPVDVGSIAILYANYTHVVTRKGSGIASMSDLRGKRVATGAAGSGTEVLATRVLTAAGLNPDTDVIRMPLGLGAATEALKADTIDALIWSGGIPTPAILELAKEIEIDLVPQRELSPVLQGQYGPQLYRTHDLLAGSYPGVLVDVPVIGVPNVLVASGRLSTEFVELLTRTLFDANETLGSLLPEVRALAWPSHPNATPIPFHPGAHRYYEEHVWR